MRRDLRQLRPMPQLSDEQVEKAAQGLEKLNREWDARLKEKESGKMSMSVRDRNINRWLSMSIWRLRQLLIDLDHEKNVTMAFLREAPSDTVRYRLREIESNQRDIQRILKQKKEG